MSATQISLEAFLASHGLRAETTRSGSFATRLETLTPAIEIPILQLQYRVSQTLNHRFRTTHS